MDGLTARRPDGRLRKLAVCATIMVLAVGPSGRPAVAQVGHDPATSPFRDITLRPGPGLFVGYLSGGRGSVDAGTSSAFTVGARYEIPAGRSLLFQLNAGYLSGDRYIIDPRADSSSPARRTGPFKSDLGLAEVALHLRLTGAKSWHGLAPYAGAGVGLAFDVNSPGDTTRSGYQFGTKITLGGATGVRWYPSRHFTLTAEARAQLWRLKHPTSFHDSTQASDGSRVVPITEPLREWTLHPWLSIGIGWTF